MKYKTARDFPLVKAGTLIDFRDRSDVKNGYTVEEDGSIMFFIHSLKEQDTRIIINELLSKNWIEEVKPREIWINLYDTGNYGAGHEAREEAIEMKGGAAGETIKFIEVIE